MAGGFPLIDRAELVFAEVLGQGSFGAVYRAEWRRAAEGGEAEEVVEVAVKRVLILHKEAQNLNELRHKNIIRFYGVSESKPDFYIVTEYAPNGSLKKYLGDKEKADLEFPELLRWAQDIISGVRYLHSEAPTALIHRDLKSDNVVLSAQMVCKLCDFGTAKPAGLPNTSVAGTAAWMSPEMMLNDETSLGKPTDIFSYGVIVWEMLTRQLPFHKMNDFQVYMMVVEKGERLALPSSCPEDLKHLIKSCWKDPPDRPRAEEIYAALEEMTGDTILSKLVRSFLAKKKTWLEEIKQKELELKTRALSLERQSRHNLSRSLAHEGSAQPQDMTHWDVKDVAQWIRSIDLSDQEFAKLSDLVQTHCITGERLLVMQREDLANLSVPYGAQLAVMRKRDEAIQQHLQHLNFPPLLDTRPQLSAKRKPKSLTISLSIVYGFYFRRVLTRTSSGPHERWKPFVDLDVDDLEELELSGRNPASLIQSLTFCFNKPHPREPFHVPAAGTSRLPFAPSEWLIGLHNDEVSVIINYADSVVLKPRNTRFTLTASMTGAGRCSAKQVDLTVKLSPPPPTPPHATPLASRLSSVNSAESFWRSHTSSTALFNPALLASPSTSGLSSPPVPSTPTWSKVAEKGRRLPSPRKEQEEGQRNGVHFGVGWEEEEEADATAAEVEEQLLQGLDAHGHPAHRKGSQDAAAARPKSFSLTPSFIRSNKSPRHTQDGLNGSQSQPTSPESLTPGRGQGRGPGRGRGRGRRRHRQDRSASDATPPADRSATANRADRAELSAGSFLRPQAEPQLPNQPPPTNLANGSAPPNSSLSSNLSLQIYGGNQKWIWSEDREDDPEISKS